MISFHFICFPLFASNFVCFFLLLGVFLSGYIGVEEPTLIPGVFGIDADWYFITNNLDLSPLATEQGWKVIYLSDIEQKNSADSVDNSIYNSRESKKLKVFPQIYLESFGANYDFIVWQDNRFNIKYEDNIYPRLKNWNPKIALSMSRRIIDCCSPYVEFENAMLQPRYARSKEKIWDYMQTQIAEGWKDQNVDAYATGFIIYNMHHSHTRDIQNMWYDHIKMVGELLCQIAFYFVVQRWSQYFQLFDDEWTYGRRSIKYNNGLRHEAHLFGDKEYNEFYNLQQSLRLKEERKLAE